MAEPSQQDVLDWVERMAKYCVETDGVPLIAGRILGWLMVCAPPEQTAGEIAEAIGASRASLTTNLRLLASMGFVTKLTKPADRTVYYRVEEDAWERVVQRWLAGMTSLADILVDGMDLVGESSGRGARLKAAHETFEWMDKAFVNAPPLPSKSRNKSRTKKARK